MWRIQSGERRVWSFVGERESSLFVLPVSGHDVWVHNRHVAKTGDIKDFVITEETGIAKGIRRIIAVTGSEAREVSRTAIALSEQLDLIERKKGKEKDTALKAYLVVSGAILDERNAQ